MRFTWDTNCDERSQTQSADGGPVRRYECEEGRKLLADAKMETAETLVDAAKKAVAAAKRNKIR